MAEMKKYVVYRTPIGTILLDYNDALWTHGYPSFCKHHCTEIERGFCEGGKALGKFYANLKVKYGVTLTAEEEAIKYHEWELTQMRKRQELL